MGKSLAAATIARYETDGYCFPGRVLSLDEAGQYRARLERVEHDLGGPLRGVYRIKPHLLLTWLAELVRHPAILDAVEDVIGPDILCWNTSFFTKEARSPGFVSWHQDATYWGLSKPDVVTAWVAFTESTPRKGPPRSCSTRSSRARYCPASSGDRTWTGKQYPSRSYRAIAAGARLLPISPPPRGGRRTFAATDSLR